MKQNYLGIIFLFLFATIAAQDKDLEQEIMQSPETKSELISKGRRLITDKFLERDLAKVVEIRNYLMSEVEDENYTALFPGELWMIMYWTGAYNELLKSINALNGDVIAQYGNRISPPRDMLFTKLVEHSWENLEMLENKILDSPLAAVQKDFLLLHLNYMISGEPLMKINQEELNKMASLYLETHPGSPYEENIKNNIRFQFVPKNWALGFEFFTGFGYLTEGLGEQFSNNIPLGVAFDVEYKKFTLFLRNYIGFGRTNRDKEISSGVWEKGSATLTFLPEASLGYTLAENDKIKLSPFVGIGAAGIAATEADINKFPELEDAQIGFSTAYTIGLNFDLKVGWNTSQLLYSTLENKSYWFLRARYGYTLPQFNNFPGHNGNIHYITLGLGGIARGTKRVI